MLRRLTALKRARQKLAFLRVQGLGLRVSESVAQCGAWWRGGGEEGLGFRAQGLRFRVMS